MSLNRTVTGHTPVMDVHRERIVRQVLQGLRYPAEKWQIVTQAELYGADAETRLELHALPARRYRDTTEVTAALDHVAPPSSR